MLLLAPFLAFAAGTADGDEAVSAAAGPMGAYDEPITLSWAVATSNVTQLLDGDTFDNTRWSRLIAEKLNINLEVAFSADGDRLASVDRDGAIKANRPPNPRQARDRDGGVLLGPGGGLPGNV